MEIVKLTESLYGEWDAFCAASDDAWFWHTSAWLEFSRLYNPDLHSSPMSFFVRDQMRIVAICPLFLETHGSAKEFTCGDDYTPTPALANDLGTRERERVLRYLFAHIDALARENEVRRVRFAFSVLQDSFSQRGEPSFNYLVKFGFFDTSLNTCVLSLQKSSRDLLREMRHGHRADITRSEKLLTCEVSADGATNRTLFNAYKAMHQAGFPARQRRDERAYELLFELLQSQRAFLLGAKRDSSYVGFAYFFTFKDNAYYGSACNDPDIANIPIGHFLQWKAIAQMRARHIRLYEVGWQRFLPTLADSWSEKETRISAFMRGFGGRIVPLFRGEKYYDAAYFLEVYQKRVCAQAASITRAGRKENDEIQS